MRDVVNRKGEEYHVLGMKLIPYHPPLEGIKITYFELFYFTGRSERTDNGYKLVTEPLRNGMKGLSIEILWYYSAY